MVEYLSGGRIQGIKGDSLGSSADGTVSGVTLDTTNEKLGSGCYSFDGSNDKVETGDKFGFLTQTGSIAFWMKPTTFNDNDVLFDSCNASSSNSGVLCKVASSSNLITFLIARGGSSSNLNYTFGSNPSGKWTHLAFTYDGTTAKIYENGSEVASGSVTSTTNTPTHNLHFGEAGSGQDGNYDGLFDDIGIWNRVLSATEIGKLANNNDPPWILANAKGGQSPPNANTTAISNGLLNWDVQSSGVNVWDVSTYDLGEGNVSDTQWVLRYKLVIDNSTAPTNADGYDVYIGLSSNALGYNNNRDGIFHRMNLLSTGKYHCVFDAEDQDYHFGGNNYTAFSRAVQDETLYVEIKRTSDTQCKIGLYSNADFDSSNLLEEETQAITASSISGLRYLTLTCLRGNVTGSPQFDGSIDDLKFYNETNSPSSGTLTKEFNFSSNDGGDAQLVSSLSDTSGLKAYYNMDTSTDNVCPNNYISDDRDNIQNVPANTRLELTDVRKIYRRAAGTTPFFETDFGSDDWSHLGNQSANSGDSYSSTTISSNRLKVIATNSGQGDIAGATAVKDLGSALTDGNWVIRFTMKLASSGTLYGNSQVWFGLSDDNTYTSSQGANNQNDDAAFFKWMVNDETLSAITYNGGSGGSGSNTGLTRSTAGSELFFEMKYDGTTLTIQRYTDSTYETTTGSATTRSGSNVTGLRYAVAGTEYGQYHGTFNVEFGSFKVYDNTTTVSTASWKERNTA